MKKRILTFMVMISILLGMLAPGTVVWAASGKTSVSVSAGTINVGDTVTVSVSATGASGERAVATMSVSWDAAVLQFVSCSTTYGGGGSSVSAVGDSFTVTLKAVSAGSSAISVSGTDGVVFDTDEELESMAGSSTSVTVNNAITTAPAENGGGGTTPGGAAGGSDGTVTVVQSADNSLKSLTISPGTLSPAFSGPTTKYSATVPNDVTSVAVSAQPANEKAVVESVTGNEGLKVGSNAINIVVRAENGVTATYTINVTRQGEGTANPGNEPADGGEEDPDAGETPEENTAPVMVNGVSYQIRDDFTAEEIPADFTENTISYHGTGYRGVSFINGMLNMLMLTPTDAEAGTGRFFIYDEMRDGLYPLVKLGDMERYVIALWAPVDFVMPENYHQTELAIREGESITAYQVMTPEESEIGSDFYLFYGVNADGTENWYQYDSMEGTYQRLNTALSVPSGEETEEITNDDDSLQDDYDALSERYKETRRFLEGVIGILVFVIAVLVVVLINQLVYRFKNRGRGQDAEEDDELWDDDTDDGDDLTPKRRFFFRGKTRPAEEDDRLEEPEDDDWEEEPEPEDDWAEEPEDDDWEEEPEDDWSEAAELEDDRAEEPEEEARGRRSESGRDRRTEAMEREEEAWGRSSEPGRYRQAKSSEPEEETRPEPFELEDDWLKDPRAEKEARGRGEPDRDRQAKSSEPKEEARPEPSEPEDDREAVKTKNLREKTTGRGQEVREETWKEDQPEESVTVSRRVEAEPSARARTRTGIPKETNQTEYPAGSVRQGGPVRSGVAADASEPETSGVKSGAGGHIWPTDSRAMAARNEAGADAGDRIDEPGKDDRAEAEPKKPAPARRRSGGNAGVPAREELWEEPASARARGRFGGNLSAEEYAERREATERFFSEEPVKKSFWHKDTPKPEESRADRRAGANQAAPAKGAEAGKASPSAKTPVKKKEEKKSDGGFEVIDFNDL